MLTVVRFRAKSRRTGKTAAMDLHHFFRFRVAGPEELLAAGEHVAGIGYGHSTGAPGVRPHSAHDPS